ncbi:MAG: RimJ/RimL family protein N-acetyltransferase [Limimaricola cinnabarinus]|jgi:RimJ/RimL family protein N-acetyltransferase|uniref:50S ribosomal protein acetyltransferase n=1 Tax=Limimaricola cinnabarinus LL-001 TaxID=1337093 RepID=U3AEJ2_9RHOB|nr:GNAT family N-acetyltransferase [Limimaricola cinnabarinus]GAD56104.1 50S ribosomal protein acetyltransferase [Limimaricola cinnabarinus LL-001]
MRSNDIKVSDGQPVIEAERFVLRPLRRSDEGLIAHYAADPRVARGTRRIPHPLPPGTVTQLIERAQRPDRTEDVWVIDGSENALAEVLGLVTLTRMDRGQSEVHYWVAPAFWNTGFASEALRALINVNPHGAAQVFAEVFQDNAVSARVLTNCGFEYLGDAEAYSVARGATAPTWTYALKIE